jgi:methyl-accepting chemotaxis protein
MASTNNNGARAVEAQRVCSASSQQNEEGRRTIGVTVRKTNKVATNSNQVSQQIDNGAARCSNKQFNG